MQLHRLFHLGVHGQHDDRRTGQFTRAAFRPEVACVGGIRMSMIASDGTDRTDQGEQSCTVPCLMTTSSKLARPSALQDVVVGQQTQDAHPAGRGPPRPPRKPPILPCRSAAR